MQQAAYRPPQQPLPNAAMLASMNIDDLIEATTRLSSILSQESELLSTMRYKELPKLHDEKTKLTTVLETYQRVLAKDKSMVKQADQKRREELLVLTDALAFNVEDNFRKVSAARAVNARVMQAIMDVVSEQHRPGTYGRNGQTTQMPDMAISVNLNEKA